MRDRTFGDFMLGALTCLCMLGFYVVVKESELARADRRQRLAERWSLPAKRRRRHSPEDDCRHCAGTGECDDGAPATCRVCRGTGLHPDDGAVLGRLKALWDGAA